MWAGCLFGGALGASAVETPLPLDLLLNQVRHVWRCPMNLSPDGKWLAHTYQVSAEVEKGPFQFFSVSGVSLAEAGVALKHARITATQGGEAIELGDLHSSSWDPVWSPDGRRIAFYSDEGGEAGLWIWERETRRRWRFPGVIVRVFFGFEAPRWSTDSSRIVCKLLPAGMTIAEANALCPEGEKVAPPHSFQPTEATVTVRYSPDVLAQNAKRNVADDIGDTEHALERELADLSVLDLEHRSVQRIVERTHALWCAFSPDGRSLAYTVSQGWSFRDQLPRYTLAVREESSGAVRVLGKDLPLDYGCEVSWSPDSRRLAYFAASAKHEGQCFVVTAADGAVAQWGAEVTGLAHSEMAPQWTDDSKGVLALAQGKLWQLAPSGSHLLAAIPDSQATAIVTASALDNATAWAGRESSTVWLLFRNEHTQTGGFCRVDPSTGKTAIAWEGARRLYSSFCLSASRASGEIAFVAQDQQHPPDAWTFDPLASQVRPLTHLNPALEKIPLGRARLVEWFDLDGRPMRGGLLLPPDYHEGQRCPLAVWVYGGSLGSNYLNTFGFTGGDVFNFHYLATRGYAVLFPDTPLRVGQTASDLARTVLPGINRLVELGFVDPDRVAVMGHSYGSWCVLALITQTTRFKAALISGIATTGDYLGDYLLSGPGYFESSQGNMGGSPWEFPQRYRENSPAWSFDRIQTPVLIAHGTRDLSLRNPDAVFGALRRLGKTVEYRAYEGEGHVFQQPANVRDFWAARLAFLANHLDLAVDAGGTVIYSGDRAQPRADQPSKPAEQVRE